MPTSVPRSSVASLALRAVLALVLLVGFYALALSIAAGMLYLVYLLVTSGSRIPLKLVLLAVIVAVTILWSILPRLDEFQPPGPRLEPTDHPRLFEALREIAEATGQSMPREVYLVPDVNAWVSSRGGVMGIGSRRIMGIGLPLLQQLSVDQLRAVLAHEFGHYHGGDVAVGPWIYQTRAAIGRTIQAFHESGSSVMHVPFQWYGSMFLRVTHGLSRHQEFQADALAARVVGPEALADGLRTVHRIAPAYDAYLQSEVAPVLEAGFRPPLAEGFSRFVTVPTIASRLDEVLTEQLDEDQADPFDTHPPLAQRLAAVEGLPPGPARPGGETLAIELLDDVDATERLLVEHLRQGLPARRDRAIGWDEVGGRVAARSVRKTAKEHAEHVQGMTVGTIPTDLAGLAGWTRAAVSHTGDAPEEALARFAAVTLGQVVLHRLAEAGWSLESLPGEPMAAVSGDDRLAPVLRLQELMDGELEVAQWTEELERLGISELSLEAPSDDADASSEAAADRALSA